MKELEGAELDLAVARALNFKVSTRADHLGITDTSVQTPEGEWHCDGSWMPSRNWSQGGPLIEEYNISVDGGAGIARIWVNPYKCVEAVGPTTLIAVCRALVSSKA
jgi:hypothetical protein